MDATLHCNDIKCRALCSDRAVTTTCCHVFCLPCADRLGLTAPRDGQRKCPACRAVLSNPDDAAIAQLNPSEDYKSSILAGLNPTIIMEITGRGLAFWNYQIIQETTYQEYLGKSLTNNYHSLSTALDNTIKTANEEIKSLEFKLQDAHGQLNEVHGKHEKLMDLYKEKSRSQQQFEKLYHSLKQQQLAAGMESVAKRDADHVLNAGGAQHHGQRNHGAPGSVGSSSSDKRRASAHIGTLWHHDAAANVNRVGVQSSHSLPVSNAARTRLPQPSFGAFNNTVTTHGAGASTNEVLRRGTPIRSSFADIFDSASNQGGSTYGLRGMKVGKAAQDVIPNRAKAFSTPRNEDSGFQFR